MRIIENPELFRSNIVLKFDEFIKDDKQSKNLEIGTYNWCIKEATNNKIIKKWDNVYFVLLYINKLKTIFANIENIFEILKTNPADEPITTFVNCINCGNRWRF